MKVLFLVANGLQLGALGCYGNQRLATPTLDRLADGGIVFDQHLADYPTAAGARQAWRTGRYPGAPNSPEPDLMQVLHESQVAAALIAEPPGCSSEDRAGWGQIDELKDRDPKRLVAAMRKALTRLRKSDRCLLRVDLAGLLPPWQVPAEFLERQFTDGVVEDDEEETEEGEVEPLDPLTDPVPGLIDASDDTTFLRLQGTYGAAVENLDDLLGRLLELDGLDDFLIVVSADRGYPLGEHGLVGEARPWLHEERVHLPLIVRRPGGAGAGLRVPFLTQPVDLPATLLEAFGLPVPGSMHGRSLWPMLRGERKPERDYACSALMADQSAEWALRTPHWHFVLPLHVFPGDPPRRPQLYVKPDDRWEVNDVIQHHQELAESLEQTLRGFAEATRQPGPLRPPPLARPNTGGTPS